MGAALGGEVRQSESGAGTPRIFLRGQDFPGLAISRSLGDVHAHNIGVSAEASVSPDVELLPGSAVVIASHGVWHRVSRIEVAARVASAVAEDSPEDAAKDLVAKAQERWEQLGADIEDATAIVVYV